MTPVFEILLALAVMFGIGFVTGRASKGEEITIIEAKKRSWK